MIDRVFRSVKNLHVQQDQIQNKSTDDAITNLASIKFPPLQLDCKIQNERTL